MTRKTSTPGPDGNYAAHQGVKALAKIKTPEPPSHPGRFTVETSGARLIAVGDPRQNQPVGAGGLWDTIEHTVQEEGVLVALTRNQRAKDPADRHAQALFRDGAIEPAVRSYSNRGHVHLDHDQRQVEDQALDAAHHDRTAGHSTLVIAQTSNEHLDELNARAQAIRHQAGQLGQERLEIPGRPYPLHEGDYIQVRHTINHPGHGPLRNGTGATVTGIGPDRRELELQLRDGTRLTLERDQIEQADLRLAYVQHPFPAQGHTTDTAHVIVGGQATRGGTYVALTRARKQTHIYAANEDPSADAAHLTKLAERMSQNEPDLPSIDTPVAHEARITNTAELNQLTGVASLREPVTTDPQGIEELRGVRNRRQNEPTNTSVHGTEDEVRSPSEPLAREVQANKSVGTPDPRECERARINQHQQPVARVWPSRGEEADTPALERDRPPGWEL